MEIAPLVGCSYVEKIYHQNLFERCTFTEIRPNCNLNLCLTSAYDELNELVLNSSYYLTAVYRS